MIEFIQGELVTKGVNYVVIRSGGIGYRLLVSAFTLETIKPVKEEVVLFTYLQIREEEVILYGFQSSEEREVFMLLLSVSGIGPKLALAVLSGLRVAELKRAIMLGDSASLVNIPGVGKKTAQRIILELKDKVGKQEDMAITEYPPDMGGGKDIRKEAVSALISLGYSFTEAQKAVPPVGAGDSGVTVEELVRAALKALAKY